MNTERPAALSVNADAIPSALKAIPRWVLWRFLPVKKQNGTTGWKKAPCRVNGKMAHVTDPSCWTSFDAVMDAYMFGDFDGVGIVIDGSGDFQGIDIDDCVTDGKLNATAQELLDQVQGYAEISPSGTGIKLFTKSNLAISSAKKPVEVYRDGRYFTVTGHVIDGHLDLPSETQDVTWFVERHFGRNQASDALALYKPPLADWTVDRVREELAPYINDLESYSSWLNVGMALHHQGQGSAEWMELWDELSRETSSYNRDEIEDKWDSFSQQRDRGQGALTLASLIKAVGEYKEREKRTEFEAVKNEVASCTDADELYGSIAARVREAGFDTFRIEQMVVAWNAKLKELTGVKLPVGDVRKLFKRVVNRGFVHVNDEGAPLPTLENFLIILDELDATVRYNCISKDIEILIPGETYSLDNRQNAMLAKVLSECERARFNTKHVLNYLLQVADQNMYNPVAQWISSIEWDGVSRVDELLATIETPVKPEFKRMVMLKWLVTAVAVAMSPEPIAPQGMLVLQGQQNKGKTRWLTSLAPKELVLVGHTLDLQSKDSILIAMSHWLVELGEIDATFKKSEISALKSHITQTVDKLRRPYAVATSSYPRRTVYFGSVNDAQFLHDQTGNRRFWVLPVTAVNHQHNVDMQQLWAEVYHIWQSGQVTHYFNPDELDQLNANNEHFVADDPVVDLVATTFDWESNPASWTYMTSAEVLKKLGLKDASTVLATKAANAIRRLNGGRMKRSHGANKYAIPPSSEAREDFAGQDTLLD